MILCVNLLDNAFAMCYNDTSKVINMNITEVRIRLLKRDEGKLKALATIIIDDCFAVHEIRIIQGQESEFITMPNKRLAFGDYKDIVHPINSETRNYISDLVLKEYRRAVENANKHNGKTESTDESSASPASNTDSNE